MVNSDAVRVWERLISYPDPLAPHAKGWKGASGSGYEIIRFDSILPLPDQGKMHYYTSANTIQHLQQT